MSTVIYFPEIRITQLAGRFGGLNRDEAVAAAICQLEMMRPEADQAIESAIALLEQTIEVALESGSDGTALIQKLLSPCDQIVTLAGTYGYVPLDRATRSLCDLLDELMRMQETDYASIRVHIQTIRLLIPGATPLAVEQTEMMLSELAKLLAHQGIAKSGVGVNGDSVHSTAKAVE